MIAVSLLFIFLIGAFFLAVTLDHCSIIASLQHHCFIAALLLHCSIIASLQHHCFIATSLLHCSIIASLQHHCFIAASLLHCSTVSAVWLQHRSNSIVASFGQLINCHAAIGCNNCDHFSGECHLHGREGEQKTVNWKWTNNKYQTERNSRRSEGYEK